MSAAAVSERAPRRRNAPADVQHTEVQPQLLSLRGVSIAGFHRLAVWHWPVPGNAVPVVCVHGLTRTGRDFDHLVREFVRQGRSVFCPDLVGRGRTVGGSVAQ